MADILFLDIDGVLNRRGTKERCGHFIGVDRVLAKRFLGWLKPRQSLKQDEGIKIVQSSTWRLYPDMWEHLHAAGIHWIDKTPDLHDAPRGLEINAWLNAHRARWGRYAILDDMGDMLSEQRPFFVQTDTDVGLQDGHLARLDAIFDAPLGDVQEAA